jgi:hypothetical protein
MVLKYRCLLRVFLIVLGSGVLMSSAAATAADYSPDEFLNLDLSKAALSPQRLGPANRFAPVPAKARAEADGPRPQARAEVAPPRHHVSKVAIHAVRSRAAATSHGVARTRLARRHRNPLDAQAMDARFQAWPCKSGGICNWK